MRGVFAMTGRYSGRQPRGGEGYREDGCESPMDAGGIQGKPSSSLYRGKCKY